MSQLLPSAPRRFTLRGEFSGRNGSGLVSQCGSSRGVLVDTLLKPALTAAHFTMLNLRQRLKRLRKDPWADIGKVKQKLPKS